MLKCKSKPFHVREDPGKLGKGKGHRFVDHGNIKLYTCGWCSVWLTSRQFQYTVGYVLCMQRRCAVIEPAVSSTMQSRQGIHRQSLTRYEYPTPMKFKALASTDIPELSAPGWHVIDQDWAALAARPYHRKRPTSTFIECCNQPGSLDPTMPSLA